MAKKPVTYSDAGVDTHGGQEFVSSIRQSVESTYSDRVLAGAGGFSALYDVSFLKEYDNPVLVSGTDGVGTKLTLARLFDRHETVGIDLVAMCVNDLLVAGANPHFFLDYIATGKLQQKKMAVIVESIAKGCRLAGCSLIGGETAEHPGVMHPDEYDLAGFVTGAVEKDKIIEGKKTVQEGDVWIGIPSSGIHSNGVSLIRKVFLNEDGSLPQSSEIRDFLQNDILLKPTIIYEPVIRPLLDVVNVQGMVHITGGGFSENVPRSVSKGLTSVFQEFALPEPFERIRSQAGLTAADMRDVYNCGYGYLVAVRQKDADAALSCLQKHFTRHVKDTVFGQPVMIGRVEKGNEEVVFEP